jgi:hypothetical protein
MLLMLLLEVVPYVHRRIDDVRDAECLQRVEIRRQLLIAQEEAIDHLSATVAEVAVMLV